MMKAQTSDGQWWASDKGELEWLPIKREPTPADADEVEALFAIEEFAGHDGQRMVRQRITYGERWVRLHGGKPVAV